MKGIVSLDVVLDHRFRGPWQSTGDKRRSQWESAQRIKMDFREVMNRYKQSSIVRSMLNKSRAWTPIVASVEPGVLEASQQ